MPEFGADAVAYFDAAQPAQIAALLGELMDDEERRRDLAARAARRGADFPLAESLGRTWSCLLELAQQARAERRGGNSHENSAPGELR